MNTRKMVLTVIFEIIAILSFSYFIVMVRYAGIGTSFAFVWLGMALFFAVCGAVVFILGKRNVSFPPAVKVVISVLTAAIIILFAVVEGMIISGMKEKTNEQYDYVIVLGARVRGTTVTKSLRKRLDKAFEYIEKMIIQFSFFQEDREAVRMFRKHRQCMTISYRKVWINQDFY